MMNTYDVYFIRHCDKYITLESDCCSAKGIMRSRGWKDYFASKNVTVYTSGFDKTKSKCMTVTNGTSFYQNKQCPHSQRMSDTAQIITPFYKSNYCIGEWEMVVKDIMREKSNALVVWEHNEIPKMINKWLPVRKWQDSSIYDYNLVITLTTTEHTQSTLSYECYDYEIQQAVSCNKDIDRWLISFSNKYSIDTNDSVNLVMIGGLLTGGVLFLVLLFFCIRRQYTRRKYVQIKNLF